MKEIREHWFDIVAADGTVRGLTGYTAADKRIYLDFPTEQIAVSDTYPSYITYSLSTGGPINQFIYVYGAQEEDIVIEANVWANHPDVRDDLAERLVTLFKDYHWDLTVYRVLTTDLEAKEDITEINEATSQVNFYRKYLRWRLRPVYKK